MCPPVGETMNILIIGAGAVGQYLAGKFAAFGHNIAIVEKSKDKVDLINKNGITVKDGEKTYSAPAKAYNFISDIPLKDAKFSYVFLCVKAYHLKSAIEESITFIDDAKIVVFQNGIGNEELAAQYFMPSSLISATTTTAVYIDEDNGVRTSGKGGIALAPVLYGEDINGIYDGFKSARFNVKVYGDYKSLKWSKLLLNMTANASCAILDMSALCVFSDSRMVRLEAEAVKEAVRVMKKLKIKQVNLPGFPVKLVARAFFMLPFFILKLFLKNKVAAGRGNKKPSLYLELLNNCRERSRPFLTENEYINGAVFNYAVRQGSSAPANRVFYESLDDIVVNNNWDKYRKKPEVLWKNYLGSRVKGQASRK